MRVRLSVKLNCMEKTVPTHAIGRGNDPTYGESNKLFPWWSITKTVLAAAVLRLADRGRLSLDNFYSDRPYTVRQLLQHTAGLNTYGGPPYRAAVAAGDPVWPVAELLTRVKADRLIFSPGEGCAYSNVGYLFVRQLIEETIDMEIDESLRVLVFEPMGIQRTRCAGNVRKGKLQAYRRVRRMARGPHECDSLQDTIKGRKLIANTLQKRHVRNSPKADICQCTRACPHVVFVC